MLCLHAKESLRKQIWPQLRIYHPNLNDKAIGWPADEEASWDLIILIYRSVQKSLLAARGSCAPTCCIAAMTNLGWTRITSVVSERNSTKYKCKLLHTLKKKQENKILQTSLQCACFSYQCGCYIFQTILQGQPQWRVPFVIYHRHISSSCANGIHH